MPRSLGRDVPPSGSQVSTDMAAVSALGVSIAELGATRQDSNIHGIDEHVRINDLASVTKILTRTYLEVNVALTTDVDCKGAFRQ